MRALLIGILLTGVTVSILLAHNWSRTVTTPLIPSPSPSVSPSPIPPAQSVDVTHDGISYRIAWLPVRDPSVITLLPNFDQKRTARSLIDSKECSKVINGGFYTKDNQPTGLFITQGKTIRDSIPNTLLNGYFVVDQKNNASILASPPDHPVRLTLQTGPILIREGKAITLAIRDDEHARRVVVGVTQNGMVVFLVIYDPENPLSGPKLADTPAIVSQLIRTLDLKDAINLDGGSASAFIGYDLALEELTAVGSFFCIKEII